MSDPGTRLLQMLEPAVRPGQAPRPTDPGRAAGTGGGAAAFEGKSFEALLSEVADEDGRGGATAVDASEDTSRPPPTNPLSPLDRIENASLTRLLGERGVTAPRAAPEERP